MLCQPPLEPPPTERVGYVSELALPYWCLTSCRSCALRNLNYKTDARPRSQSKGLYSLAILPVSSLPAATTVARLNQMNNPLIMCYTVNNKA